MSQAVGIPQSPNIILRLVWFVFLGWWLGGFAITAAWILNVTIIGLPIGLWLLNRLPTIMTLKNQAEIDVIWTAQGPVAMRREPVNFLVRAIYFLLVGWWFSLLWLGLAYLLTVSILGIPLGFWMINRIGAVTTLHR